ncbi:YFH1 [Candida oxycetoniae]|uniref:ferroxidase n=1 Tax=Candida oxycetoniae TaxID=497107 RepID=A0AAI9WZQ4_9ASCO|nr:YFH1 [Candida oxycetoniae]KAI3406656.2 YFH1 [Candida oxycetoniae]
MFRRALFKSGALGIRSIAWVSRIPKHSKVLFVTPRWVSQTSRMYSLSTQGENLEGKIDQLSDNEYSRLSNEYLEELSDSLEALGEQFGQVDSELNHGVLTLTLPPNGTYVINKQPPNKQIWLSSPISGPKRFDLIEGKWVTLRDGSSLTELLEEEVSKAIGSNFKLNIDR